MRQLTVGVREHREQPVVTADRLRDVHDQVAPSKDPRCPQAYSRSERSVPDHSGGVTRSNRRANPRRPRPHTAAVQDANERGEATAGTIADSNLPILHNGLGGYAAALDAAERVRECGELVHSTMARPELITPAT
jgi:hypothetical protein